MRTLVIYLLLPILLMPTFCKAKTESHPTHAYWLNNFDHSSSTYAANFCAKAKSVTCNNTYAGESNLAESNLIGKADYNSCETIITTNDLFNGPDRVFKLVLTQTTNLKLTLTITTPGIDLDVFVFDGCQTGGLGAQLVENAAEACVVAYGIQNSSQTRNETVAEVLPAGTYYIVVDGPSATDKSKFDLKIECNAPLASFCQKATQTLTCGSSLTNQTTIQAGNGVTNGHYNACNPTVNSPYNASDRVYILKISQPSFVRVALTILQGGKDLNLFIFDGCQFSGELENACVIDAGTSDSRVSRTEEVKLDLDKGTYYIVVDGPTTADEARFDIQVQCLGSFCRGTIPITCDTILTNQSTANANVDDNVNQLYYNQNAQYVNTADLYNAPDNVYQLDLATTTRLRITITILDPNINLDVFVFSECDLVNNSAEIKPYSTRLDIIEDVLQPGRYYIVVDGPKATDKGRFNLQIECGGGFCQKPIKTVSCNTNLVNETTADQSNNIGKIDYNNPSTIITTTSIYNAPDRVYRMDLTTRTKVKITLTNIDTIVNLDLFVLNNCNGSGRVVAYGIARNNKSETVEKELDKGTYYIVVDGATPTAKGRYKLQISCLNDETDVCDLGGTFIYRSDGTTFPGKLNADELGPAQVLQADCVQSYYLERFDSLPNPLYADIYVFYNNDGVSTVSANLIPQNESDQTTVAIFSCDCEEVEVPGTNGTIRTIINCTQTCHDVGDNATVENAAVGFYYIVVLGPKDAGYELSIFPNNTSCFNTTILNCGEPITSSVTENGNNFTTTGENGTSKSYQSCYAGNRVYNGEDKIYKFQLENPSVVDIRFNASSAMGIFLYDFLCGENCIASAQNADNGGAATISGVSLPAGVYYLIVDKATFGGNGSFSLSIDCVEDLAVLDVYLNTDETCLRDSSALHEVTLKGLGTSLINNAPINIRDQVIFSSLQYSQGSVVENPLKDQTYVYWNGTEVKLKLYKDAPDADEVKCSYDEGETFVIKVKRASNIENTYEVEGIFQALQAPTVTGGSVFATGKKSVVTGLRQISPPTSLRISPALRGFPNTAGSFPLFISANGQWEIVKGANTNWITASRYTGEGSARVEIALSRNNTTLTRADSLFIYINNQDRRRLIVQQQGCTGSDAFAGNDQTVCQGTQVQLTATGGGTYRWSTGATTAQTPLFTPTATASYIVEVTNNGCTDYDTVTVRVVPQPKAPTSNGDQRICSGASIPLLSVIAEANQTINWYDQSSGGTPLASNTSVFRPTLPGTYYAEAVNSTGCKSPSRTAVRLIINQPPIVSAGTDVEICAGNPTQLQATADGGGGTYTFAWDQNLGNGEIKTVNPLQSTTYTVTVTDANNCSNTDDVKVTVNDLPTLESPVTSCASDRLSYSVHIKSNGNLIRATLGTVIPETNQSFRIANIPNGREVTITAINTSIGCEKSLKIAAPDCSCLAVNAPISNGDKEICAGDPIPTLSVSVTSNTTVDWYDENGAILLNNSTSYKPLKPGTYFAQARNLNDNCTSSALTSVKLIENPLPILNAGDDKSICSGDNAQLSATATGGTGTYNFSWNNNLGLGFNKIVNPTVNTTYRVSVTDSKGCSAADEVRISIKPTPTLELGEDVAICSGDSAQLKAVALGGSGSLVYSWGNNLGTSGSSQIVSPQTTTTYTLTVTDAGSCTATDQLIVTVNPTVAVEIGAIKDVNCFGENTGSANVQILSGTPPYRWQWADGNGSQREVPNRLSAGDYRFTITDQNNCQTQSNFEIKQPAAISISPILTQPTMGSTQNGSIQIDPKGGTPPYTFRWTLSGALVSTQEDPNNLQAGNYLVQITDAKGCIFTSNTIKVLQETSTAVDNTALAQQIQVFPNPTSGKVMLILDVKNVQNVSFMVLDALGKMVIPQTQIPDGVRTQDVNLDAYPSGLYIVRIFINQQIVSKSIILSKS